MSRDPNVISTKNDDEDPIPFHLPENLLLTQDENVFYTASLHFLQQRLKEKTSEPRARDVSRSCCSFTMTSEEPSTSCASDGPWTRDVGCGRPYVPSLTMGQLLPFPKHGKEGFFQRLKQTFSKHRTISHLDTERITFDELEKTRFISRYRFPRCERMDIKNNKTSYLVQISEERSAESLAQDHIIDTSTPTQKNSTLRCKKRRAKKHMI